MGVGIVPILFSVSSSLHLMMFLHKETEANIIMFFIFIVFPLIEG